MTRPKATRKKHGSGFTLIELMVVIGVMAILAGTSVPAIINWLPAYRLKKAARDLFSDFQRAKLVAIKRNANVVINFSPGVYSPSGQVGAYYIFIDNGEGGGLRENKIRDGNEPIVVVSLDGLGNIIPKAMPKSVSIYSTTYPSNLAGFNPRGLPFGAVTYFVNLRNTPRYYRTSQSPAGSIRLETSNDGVNWALWG